MHDFIVRLIACFIWNDEKRREFRRKHLNLDIKKYSKELKINFDGLRADIKKIDYRNQLFHLYNKHDQIFSFEDDLYNFYKNIPAATGNLRILQKTLLILLEEVAKICKENDISYWIQAGTLLGAVRGGVFIPWDDDLDIGMTETDLRKLKKVLQNNPLLRIDDYYHFCDGYVGRFTRIKFKNSKINCFLDIPVYEFCSGTDIDEAWNNICIKRNDFEKKISELSKKLSKKYHNEIITDEKDLKIVKEFFDKEIKGVHQDNGDFIYWAHYSVPSGWKRIFSKDMFFPLKNLKFENGIYNVPNRYNDYLKLQYGDYWLMPWDTEPKHVNDFSLLDNIDEYKKILKNKKNNKVIGYTAGAFDVFHIGHLNLLRRAKENCDYLIVGVTTDELIEKTKNKQPLATLEERMEILRQIKYVDEVVVQDDLDKVAACEKYHYNVLFSGDDWKGNPRWNQYEKALKKMGVDVIYFPYTKTISSTKIKDFITNNGDC